MGLVHPGERSHIVIHKCQTDSATPEGAFIQGSRAAFPIAIGYLPIGITFGLLARAAGVPDQITILMSLLIFAGASQFVGVNFIF